ncbi:MAG TPA: DUF3999 family protein, partial [Thermoanaerobaculia bacterium]|nr:DUF3999 family protein [Thermoanaerobaculia bacterium]
MRRALLALALLAAAAPSRAAGAPRRWERDVTPGGKGPNRLAVDVPLLAGAAPLAPGTRSGLSDLRLFAADGAETPYLLIGPPRTEPSWASARVLPIAPTKTRNQDGGPATSGFEADLGASQLVDRLDVAGLPAPYLKRLRLEGSGDRSRWTLLAAEGTLFDLPEEGLSRTWIAFPPSELRYLRVTWDDARSGRVPLPRAVRARRPGPGAAAPQLRVAVPFERRAGERGRTRYRIRLPGPRLPIEAFELVPDAENVLRRASVTELRLAGSQLAPVALGSATLRRAARDGLHADALSIPVTVPAEPEVELVVEDGDNPPLEVREIAAVFAPLPWIYFESARGAPLVARFGAAGEAAPRYDLEASRDAIERGGLATSEARWGERRPAAGAAAVVPAVSPIAPGAPLDAAEFRFARPVPDGPPGLTTLLLDAHVLSHAPGLASVRIVDGSGRQVPYIPEARGDVLRVPLAPLTPSRLANGSAASGVTTYAMRLPEAHLPEARLVLTTPARVFTREVSLLVVPPGADDRPATPIPMLRIAASPWAHADLETDAPPLTLALPPLETVDIWLEIHEGDNSPLPLGRPLLELPARRVRFFREGTGALRLLYGSDSAASPRYDLALLAPRFLGEPAHETALTGEAPAPAAEKTSMAKTVFWAVLVAAVVLLLLLVGRLVGKAEPREEEPDQKRNV